MTAARIQQEFVTMQWGGCLTQCNSSNLTDALERIKGKSAELAGFVHQLNLTNLALCEQMATRQNEIQLLGQKTDDITTSFGMRVGDLESDKNIHIQTIKDVSLKIIEAEKLISSTSEKLSTFETTTEARVKALEEKIFQIQRTPPREASETDALRNQIILLTEENVELKTKLLETSLKVAALESKVEALFVHRQ